MNHFPAAVRHALYQKPQLYDLAFGFRDVPQECDGILAIAQRYGAAKPRSVAEVGCGPAHHLREFKRRGLKAYGVDVNPPMLAYARRLCKEAKTDVHLQCADMRAFKLTAKVDLATCLFDSFSHCTTDMDAIAALRCTAAALRKNGLFIIEFTHPADYFSSESRRTSSRWTQRYPHAVFKTRFSTTRIDPIRETYVASMTIDATFAGGHKPQRIIDRQLHRMWLRSSIRYVTAACGAFDILDWYGDLNPGVGLGMADAAWRMVAVLRRR